MKKNGELNTSVGKNGRLSGGSGFWLMCHSMSGDGQRGPVSLDISVLKGFVLFEDRKCHQSCQRIQKEGTSWGTREYRSGHIGPWDQGRF